MLEFTDLKMRAYKNEDVVTQDRTTITAITQADPAVITVASTTDLADDDEIIITGIKGMIELNGRQVKLANGSGSTFELVDPVTGSDVDSTGFGAYTSGGNVVEVIEIDTPYLESELDDLHWASKDGVMYITHFKHAPRKLTVDSGDVFTLATYARTSDPFTPTVSAFIFSTTPSLGTKTLVYAVGGTTINEGGLYTITGVVGTTELNGNTYRLEEVQSADEFSPPKIQATLKDPVTGADIDSSSFTAYISGGTVTPDPDNPIAVTFYEGRLFFMGTDQRPDTIFGSRSPDSSGDSRYDDFTGGTDDDNAVFFTLASTGGQTNHMAWGQGTSKFLFAGTFSGPFRIGGSGIDSPITPSSINARQFGEFGCEAVPVAGVTTLFFIQRGGRTIRSVRFSDRIDDFESRDMLLNAEHIGEISRIKRVVLQAGRPDILWAVREDGILAGLTTQDQENITGWHRHRLGGPDAKILDVQTFQRTDRNDQLWIVAERTINGVSQRTVEVQADDPEFPDREDFFTDSTTEAADLLAFRDVLYRRQEEYIHLDGAATYNGTDRGVAAAATLTPGALTGDGVTFTASAAVFEASDVGSELWKKPNRETGVGSGRAVITAFTSPTEVTCDIEVDFNSTDAIAAGDWYVAVKTISGIWHQEGERIAVVGDGGVVTDGKTDEYDTITISDGKITLSEAVGVAHVGLAYEGTLQTQNLEMGGRSGPAQAKPRNIVGMFIRFLNTLGARYGTNIYKTKAVNHRDNTHTTSRPAPVFSGLRKLVNPDDWREGQEKFAVVVQRLPLPCIVQFVDLRFETGDEG